MTFSTFIKNAIAASLLTLVWAVAVLVADVDRLVKSTEQTVRAVPRELAAIRGIAESLPPAVQAELAGARKDLVSESLAWRTTADSRVASIQADTKSQASDAVARADARLAEVTGAVRGFRDDVRPVLAETQETLAQASGTVAVLRPQALGLIAASKVTAGETAQAMRRIDAALPSALATWQQIGGNSQKTTAATAKAMANLAEASRPLPKWLRYPLAITGAMAPTAAGALGAAAATGAFQ